jgi:hypothetical protein
LAAVAAVAAVGLLLFLAALITSAFLTPILMVVAAVVEVDLLLQQIQLEVCLVEMFPEVLEVLEPLAVQVLEVPPLIALTVEVLEEIGARLEDSARLVRLLRVVQVEPQSPEIQTLLGWLLALDLEQLHEH